MIADSTSAAAWPSAEAPRTGGSSSTPPTGAAPSALEAERNCYFDLFDLAPVGYVTLGVGGQILLANSTAAEFLGQDRATLRGRLFSELVVPEDTETCRQHCAALQCDGQPRAWEVYVQRPAGARCRVFLRANLACAQHGQPQVRLVLMEGTVPTHRETEQEITSSWVDAMAEATDYASAVARLLDCVREWSGCDAVGIRLREGEGFPYFQAVGFSPDFLQSEKELLSFDAAGQVCRDESGAPILECVCGLVLRGAREAQHPCFTPFGSFWTNSTSALQGSPLLCGLEHVRHRCHRTGYESVALIPLRTGRKPLGLLQLNHGRSGWFTPAMIATLETAAGAVSSVLVRRQAEESLRAEEHKSRSLVEHSPEGMHFYRLDPAGRLRLVGANASAERTLGVRHAELIGLPIEEAFPSLRGTEIPEMYRRLALAELAPQRFETPYQDDRISGCFEVHAFSTGPQSMAASFIDITARKRAEQELKQQQATLREITDAIPALVWTARADGCVDYCNRAWLEHFGVTREAVLGSSWMRTLHPEDVPESTRIWAEACRTGEVYEVEQRLGKAGGGHAWFLTRAVPLKDAAGNVVKWYGTHVDISNRRSAEEALRESEEHYRTLFESAAEGIVMADEQRRICHANPAYCALYGYTEEEVTKLGVEDLHPAEAMERVLAAFDAQARGALLTVPSVPCLRKDGSVFFAEVTARRMTLAGKPVLLGFFKDVTERLRLEAQSRNLERGESLARMASAIAHRFNNHLQVVLGDLELLNQSVSGEAGERLASAARAARDAAEISNLMLLYLGQGLPESRSIDAAAACRDAVPLLRGVLPPQAAWETELPQVGHVVINPVQFQLVLKTLATNAGEALMDGRGSVRLSLSVVPGTTIPTTGRFPLDWQPQAATYVCVEVRDTGRGIEPNAFDHLFDPFYSTKLVGRGLGLPVAQGIIRAAGGGFVVSSHPGKGSVFRAFLPQVDPVAAPPPPPTTAPPPLPQSQAPVPTAGPAAIMVVDDERSVRRTVCFAIQQAGYIAIEAEDGEQAIELFKQRNANVRCVICDLTMPRMDGWEVLAALRRLAAGLPIILCSGYSEAQMMEGHQDDAELPQAFLVKPYTLKTLRDTLTRILGASSGS